MLLLILYSIQFEWNATPNIAIQCNIEENAYNRIKPKTSTLIFQTKTSTPIDQLSLAAYQ